MIRDLADLREVPFRARLDAWERAARAAGELPAREVEALLLDPGFDDEAFEAFRQRLADAGIRLPGDDEEPSPASRLDARDVRGEPARDLLDLYLEQIGRVPLLSHEETLETSARARSGDEGARKRLILANLRLVVHVARRYRDRGLPFLDLIEEGNLGLIHVADRFDPGRALRFSTYAMPWIRQSILRGLAEQSRAVRIPVQMFRQMNRYVAARRALASRLGRDPLEAELAQELAISVARAGRLGALVSGLQPLDARESLEAFEAISAESLGVGPPSVERLVELQLEHEMLDRLLRSLDTREEQVIRIRYGFHDGIARSLQETGDHFSLSRERVRQIEARALQKLRAAIELADGERPPFPALHLEVRP